MQAVESFLGNIVDWKVDDQRKAYVEIYVWLDPINAPYKQVFSGGPIREDRKGVQSPKWPSSGMAVSGRHLLASFLVPRAEKTNTWLSCGW